jgi:alpha-D-xyloside xylohydrolase
VPTGEQIESIAQAQNIAKVRVYPSADATFALYNDDGYSYAYESGQRTITTLHWDDQARKLTQEGAKAWTKADPEIVEIIGQ